MHKVQYKGNARLDGSACVYFFLHTQKAHLHEHCTCNVLYAKMS